MIILKNMPTTQRMTSLDNPESMLIICKSMLNLLFLFQNGILKTKIVFIQSFMLK